MQPWNCISPLSLSVFSINIPCIKPPQTGNFSEQFSAWPRSLCNLSVDECWGSLRAKHRLGTGQTQLCDCKEIVNMLQAWSLRRDLWCTVLRYRYLVLKGAVALASLGLWDVPELWSHLLGLEQFFRCPWGKFREEVVNGVNPEEEQEGWESLERQRELLKCRS